MDYRAAERWDARKTSANTADLRGKVLRIKPTLAPIASDSPPGIGSDVHDPGGQPVPGRHWPRPVPRSTRWASASRSRCTPTRRTRASIGVGEYCHDASTDRAGRAPAGIVRVEPGQQAGQPRAGRSASATTRPPTRWCAGTTPTGRDHRAEVRLLAGPDPVRHPLRAGGPDARSQPTFQGLDMIPKPEPATIWKKYPARRGANPGQQSAAGLRQPDRRRHAADGRPDLPLQRGDGRLGRASRPTTTARG